MKQLLVIKRNGDGKNVEDNILEKACQDAGVGVMKKFELSRTKNTGVLLSSKEEVEKLKHALGDTASGHELETVVTRVPRIKVTGLER